MTPFAAVLLAGGQSRRMGRDKALLPLPDGSLLWQRQLGVLRELRPAELFISGPAREGFPPDVPSLADTTPGLGPLAGIAAALETIRSPLLIVLAVDLPEMTADYLRSLCSESIAATTPRGVIPRRRDGFFEPLAAVYLKTALPAARLHLFSEDRSLQTFVRALIASDQATARPVTDPEIDLFGNWNQPERNPPVV